jgi:hypothetical protein
VLAVALFTEYPIGVFAAHKLKRKQIRIGIGFMLRITRIALRVAVVEIPPERFDSASEKMSNMKALGARTCETAIIP